jgi:hypothetical protein
MTSGSFSKRLTDLVEFDGFWSLLLVYVQELFLLKGKLGHVQVTQACKLEYNSNLQKYGME